MDRYLLGVDGGNSKTHYMLCHTNGEFVDFMNKPTISHEQLGGFDNAKSIMAAHLDELFKKNGINVNDISAAAFGLAGADLPSQIEILEQKVKELGLSSFKLANDGILGVKAVADTGVCAINGTGTVVVGIDEAGNVLQVGGIGEISGDLGGGGYIMRQGVKAMYAHHFRAGGGSLFIKPLMEMLGAKSPLDLLGICANSRLLLENMREIIIEIDKAALSGDAIACQILDNVGTNIGNGAAGCINYLKLSGCPNVVMAGSIWNKIKYEGMKRDFKAAVLKASGMICNFFTPDVPPVCGAIIWAKEIYDGCTDTKYRQELPEIIKKYTNGWG